MCIANRCLDAYGKELRRNPKDEYEDENKDKDKENDDPEPLDPNGLYPSKYSRI